MQDLSQADFQPRVMFCVLQQCVDPRFAANVLFIDESSFARDDVLNFHSIHQWAEENSHLIHQSRHQQQFSVNVLAGIVTDHLIGPYFLLSRLNGQNYKLFRRKNSIHCWKTFHWKSTAKCYLCIMVHLHILVILLKFS